MTISNFSAIAYLEDEVNRRVAERLPEYLLTMPSEEDRFVEFILNIPTIDWKYEPSCKFHHHWIISWYLEDDHYSFLLNPDKCVVNSHNQNSYEFFPFLTIQKEWWNKRFQIPKRPIYLLTQDQSQRNEKEAREFYKQYKSMEEYMSYENYCNAVRHAYSRRSYQPKPF